MIGYFTYLMYLSCWRLLRALPKSVAYQLGDVIADLTRLRNGKSITRLHSNLSRVKPEYDEVQMADLLKKSMRSHLRYWIDTFRFTDWDKSHILNSAETINDKYFFDALAAGKGLIVSLPHAGNWDHAGAYFCAQGISLTTVVEHVKPERLFRRFLQHREKMGMEALDLNSRVTAILAQRLRSGKLVALVADRDLSKSGVTVNFFDGIARMPGGPATLALQTGAALITAFVSYTPTGIRIEFEKPIELPTYGSKEEMIQVVTQICADRFAANIAHHPQDWHMLQRIWVDGDFVERSS